MSLTSRASEAPAILQLHKWGASGLQLNLSQFREAFLSPTRELLLLLSYQREALLLPLVKDDAVTTNDHHGALQNPGCLDSYSPKLRSPSKLDLQDDVSITSETIEIDYPRSNGYQLVCDVNSLVWGICGDSYDQHEAALFREILVVSGNHGVTVHAFRQPPETVKTSEFAQKGESGGGKWVEWGPSTTLPHCSGVDRTQRVGENLDTSFLGTGEEDSSIHGTKKRWMRSFLTNVDTSKSKGYYWTRFPESSEYPSSAVVVSFGIFDSDSGIWGFLFDRITNSNEKGTFSDSYRSICGFSYKCKKVFASSSYDLLGFALTLVDPIPVNTTNESERDWRRFVLVARIGSRGLQWLSLVKLDEYVDNVPTVEWADFGFSDKFLVCLSTAGLLYFFGATTGDYVAHIDISKIYGFHPQFHFHEEEAVQSDAVGRSTNIKGRENALSCQTGEVVSKIMFRRLQVTSDSLMLAVIDDYGVVYVICANDHIPGIKYSAEKSRPQFERLGVGAMVGWQVGGAEISHQRPLSSLSPDAALLKNTSNFNKNFGSIELPQFQDGMRKKFHSESFITGFTSASQMVEKNFERGEVPSRTMRSIFVPTDRYAGDDIIFFSTFGITRLTDNQKSMRNSCSEIVHFNLYVDSSVNDDISSCSQGQRVSAGEAVGCIFQGCFYLVTEAAFSVVLPSISISSDYIPIEAIGYRQSNTNGSTAGHAGDLFEMQGLKQPWRSWKTEILDRVLLYEGHEEADRLCFKNDWDVKISRMRRLQVALDYLNYEEIEISLEILAGVSLAEEGVLRLLFAAVYLMFDKVGNDNEVSAASRLLALATQFAIKMIRKYGLLQQRKNGFMSKGLRGMKDCYPPVLLPDREHSENSRRLQEMAQFLETIRNLQCRLSSKFSRPSQRLVDGSSALILLDSDVEHDDAELSNPFKNALLLETSNQPEVPSVASDLNSNSKKLALVSVDSVDSKADLNLENFGGASVLAPEITASGRITFPFENPKDMIARWEIDNLDQKTIVKDALLSGRLPLAVLKLHLQHLGDTMASSEPHDTFSEVRDIGRAIAYDLFLKAETGLAVATLQKLGEDAESCLRQLVFGTVRRSLRVQVAAEMKRYGYLGPYDWKILEGISLIERVYPCCSFWRTYSARRNELVVTENINSPEEIRLRMLPSPSESVAISCGDVDGVVLGLWTNVGEHSSIPAVDVDSTHAFYWAAAAVWSDAWNQRTIDRIVLGQPFLMGVNVLWESQLEYHICHNDWVEVSKLLDMIPSYSLSSGSLRISLENLNSTSVTGCNMEFEDYRNYVCSIEDLDAVCMDVPEISILRVSADSMCSMWLRTLMEKQLAKKFIFLKEYWEGTTEIVRLLAQSGFITCMSEVPLLDELVDDSLKLNFSNSSSDSNSGAPHGLHKLVVYHCSQHNFPNLLDLYLDHHKLALNNEALSLIQDAVGDNQWAKWLLLLRVKGKEYDASFSNARSIASHNLVPGSSLAGLEIHDLIRTVDDIAEGAGELAAIATLMYAPVPIQDCLSTGSVNRHHNSSAQCTLESLRPAMQRFPTVWRTLVAACFGQDPTFNYLSPRAKVFGSSKFSEYLNWRDNIFYSTGHDTSLLQMLPGWFSKAVRRLIQLYVQGPLGWQSLEGLPAGESFLLRAIDYVDGSDQGEISTMSWEAAIQRHVEEQLYGSSVEGSGLGLEHHLHRGRALAAFNHLLSVRVQKLKLETGTGRGNSGSSAQVQSNVQSDVHTLLAPVVKSEEPLLSSVIPLAIMHFEDSVLVASCAFLLELCGLSASMLQIDIASLRRISSFYKSSDSSGRYGQLSPKDSTFPSTSLAGDITDSLARALAEDYLKHGSMGNVNERDSLSNTSTKQPSRALMVVLQHLEKASLPVIISGTSCGSWLMNGNGDGTELRAQQKAASQHWNLVTAFCRMHQIHLSTKYLAALARDNDWVGFLSEAQVGGYPFETTIQVASKEFNDPRLKVHISTVLKAMQSRKDVVSSSSLDSAEKISKCSILEEKSYIPIELFGIIADCEKQVRPGEALLLKAKDLCWSLLAMIASCFPDVCPLSCLTVWLEITAARETSSIKVNDIASQIANNVGAAVEATNLMSVSGRPHALHYNRRNSKRRRLLESTPLDILTSKVSDVSTTSSAASLFALNNNIIEDEREKQATQSTSVTDESSQSLSKMVAVLCEQRLFLPLLRAFEMFLPSCSLLPFIRALQAFSQMRLSEASVHLGSFSSRIKEESLNLQTNIGREGFTGTSWISSTAVKASDAMLSTCPSPYERRCLLQLLIATDFGDGGSAMTYYRRLYWKINLAEPSLRKDDGLQLGNESLDDASLLEALEMNGHWEQARNWAKQLEASGGSWKSAAQHVTEKQAESMVAEWKEFLWDVPEERVALWGHCQTLFLRYSFPPLQAGLFFLKHAEAVEKDLPAKELHELLLLSLQWLSGMITQSAPVYPLHLLREIETRAWLLAVESEAQLKSDGDIALVSSNSRDSGTGKSSSIIDRTASIISKMDNHINTMKSKVEKNDARDYSFSLLKNSPVMDASFTNTSGGSSKLKRRSKGFGTSRRPLIDTVEKNTDSDDSLFPLHTRPDTHLQDENIKMDISLSRWEESIGPQELERAVLSLLEFGQITAARQLQHKLSPAHIPSEFVIVDAALKLASASTPSGTVAISMLDEEVRSVIKSYNLPTAHNSTDPMQVLENLISIFTEGRGRGLCRRILSVVKAANVLGISFSEAFGKQPVELLQLLSLKAQDSFEEAYLLVQTHSMPAASIAQILAESFLKGLLAAHRGGYIDSQKDEGPAPLLWRFSDFLTWAELCPSEPEVGHALMRLVITGQEIPHACEVELLILSHHFYKSSACLDGVDVLVALAATRVEAYVSEGDFPCLARLITGVGNFHALNFILGILIENGQLDLLLQKYSAAADANSGTAEAVRGFRMAVLTSLKQFNPNDMDAFAMVYNHFDMKHETASLLESRAEQSAKAWFLRYDKDQNEDLLESMRFYIEAAEVHSSIDAGNKTRAACAQASLVSLQIRMPDIHWLNLTATNARRVLVEQSRFQEALIVAEAYGLNQPGEWALVLWNQMLKPELTEQFVEEFVTVLPLHPTMLVEIAKFYRSEVAARGDQSHFSVWLTGGGLPADWAKYLGRSFRCLLKRTRDLRLRLHLATLATGFVDVIDACAKALDRVPDNVGPLVLRKGHGGAYLPLM